MKVKPHKELISNKTLKLGLGNYIIEFKLTINKQTKEVRVNKCFINKVNNSFSEFEKDFKLSNFFTLDYILTLLKESFALNDESIIFSRQARKRLRRFNIRIDNVHFHSWELQNKSKE